MKARVRQMANGMWAAERKPSFFSGWRTVCCLGCDDEHVYFFKREAALSAANNALTRAGLEIERQIK